MGKMTHTPGPWLDGGPLGFARLITNLAGANIACVYGPRTTPEAAANASLIAAAPEMLEALKLVERDRLNCNGRVLELHAPIIRAAIAKAEGR